MYIVHIFECVILCVAHCRFDRLYSTRASSLLLWMCFYFWMIHSLINLSPSRTVFRATKQQWHFVQMNFTGDAHTSKIKKSKCRFVNKSLLKEFNSTQFYDARLFGAMLFFMFKLVSSWIFMNEIMLWFWCCLSNIFRNGFRFSWETALQLHRNRN